jgi:hypothetical protein
VSASVGAEAGALPRAARDDELWYVSGGEVAAEAFSPDRFGIRIELSMLNRIAGVEKPQFVSGEQVERGEVGFREKKENRGACRASVGERFAARPRASEESAFVGKRLEPKAGSDRTGSSVHDGTRSLDGLELRLQNGRWEY